MFFVCSAFCCCCCCCAVKYLFAVHMYTFPCGVYVCVCAQQKIACVFIKHFSRQAQPDERFPRPARLCMPVSVCMPVPVCACMCVYFSFGQTNCTKYFAMKLRPKVKVLAGEKEKESKSKTKRSQNKTRKYEIKM